MRKLWGLLAITLAVAGLARADYEGNLAVNIYSHYSNDNGSLVTAANCCPVTGDGTPYSGLVGSFFSPDIMFGTHNNWQWHPQGQKWFAATIAGTFDAPIAGAYRFTLASDDGSKLFIDNSLVVNDGGAHPRTLVTNSVFLTAGDHALDVNFFNCCGVLHGRNYGHSGVNLYLPGDQPLTTTPEPSSLFLILTGLGAIPLVRLIPRLGREYDAA